MGSSPIVPGTAWSTHSRAHRAAGGTAWQHHDARFCGPTTGMCSSYSCAGLTVKDKQQQHIYRACRELVAHPGTCQGGCLRRSLQLYLLGDRIQLVAALLVRPQLRRQAEDEQPAGGGSHDEAGKHSAGPAALQHGGYKVGQSRAVAGGTRRAPAGSWHWQG